MTDPKTTDSPSVRSHRHQVAWQILVPFLLFVAILIAAAVLVITAGSTQTRLWADISIIWMLTPMLAVALLLTVMLGFLIYGVAKLIQITPRYTGRVQQFAVTVSAGTRKVADGATKPVVWFQQVGATIQSFLGKLLR